MKTILNSLSTSDSTKSEATTGAAVTTNQVSNDNLIENTESQIVKIEDIKLTLDDYLKNRNSQQNNN